MRNLMLSTTETQIEEVFVQHAPVERVKKIRDYAFIHFHTKEDAHAAMDAMNGGESLHLRVIIICHRYCIVCTTVQPYENFVWNFFGNALLNKE